MFEAIKAGPRALSRSRVRGTQHIVVRKADGTIRKQFQEWSPFAWLRKHFGIAIPNLPLLTGRMVSTVSFPNLVTNAGLAAIADKVGGVTGAADFDYVAVGEGTTAANASDTTLETEITDSGLERAQDGSPTRSTTSVANDTLEVGVTFSVTGTKAVTEMGLLNAASSGTLLGRNVFSAINVANGDSLTATYKVQFS